MARILVVDDDEDVRTAVKEVLEHAGHIVTTAADGRQAVRVYAKSPADLVLCDLFMPNRDGLEAIGEMCGRFPGVKIIAMTGAGTRGGVDMLAAARHLGAVGVLVKPMERGDLLRAVASHTSAPPKGGA